MTVKSTECIGIVLLDYGATRNYISLAYAKRARLEIRQDAVNRSVRMPNGQTMRVYGTAEIVLDIAEWRGKVRGVVLDLVHDFNVVLGMEWHREWEPISDWEKLGLTINTTSGPKRIRRLPTVPKIEGLEGLNASIVEEFNLITEKELAKMLKKPGELACVWYFICEQVEPESTTDCAQLNSVGHSADVATAIGSDNHELQELL